MAGMGAARYRFRRRRLSSLRISLRIRMLASLFGWWIAIDNILPFADRRRTIAADFVPHRNETQAAGAALLLRYILYNRCAGDLRPNQKRG